MSGHIDLHRQAASELFDVPYEEVTPEQRLFAKKRMYFELYSNNPIRTPKLVDCGNIESLFK